MKTAIAMAIVMNLEPANVMPIGIALQIVPVNKSSILSLMALHKTNLYWNMFSEFMCNSNADCNKNGICTDQKCQCIPGWDSQEDCTSKW